MNTLLIDPLREALALRDAVNRLFDEGLVRETRTTSRPRSFLIDLVETPEALILKATLPGADKEKLEVHFQSDTVTVKAHVNGEVPEGRYLVRERYTGPVERSIPLPLPVNPDAARAVYRDGVLTLTLPKAESVKPRHITVES
ncbi:MAG TPA: Hsp20/alpha crystallin family protein [Candidatus Nitrosotenuis sp.]|jgi:HSP20 family protein|nr:Hsp20/alpha crystallin family protein [Candidatus Nitrosotenuis sp.]